MRKIPKNFVVCIVTVTIITFVISSRDDLSIWPKNTLKIDNNQSSKYVLIWTTQKTPLSSLGRGNGVFYNRNCSFKNCHITSDRAYLKNISGFDAIMFNGPELLVIEPQGSRRMPEERFPHQSYIFTSMESAQNYALDAWYNNVFNFSWTYKLNSEISFSYMAIKDNRGEVIGPNVTVPWIKDVDMIPINDTIKQKLANKSIAAAWFVSNCKSQNRRRIFASRIISKLRMYNMSVDVYGKCGNKKCPRNSMAECLKKLQRDYYFYFAFENSFSEDYVSEMLLYALQNYAVPIVYGGADYKRFMPDGIYINAREMSVITLVKHMIRIMKDKDRYHAFFKWHNHYTYHNPEDAPDTDPFCSFCSFMNKINKTKVSTIKNFYEWWNDD